MCKADTVAGCVGRACACASAFAVDSLAISRSIGSSGSSGATVFKRGCDMPCAVFWTVLYG
eukprot:3605071-Prymnesium_polylepis.1